MVEFPKSRTWRIANIFLQKIKHYYLGWPIGGYPCELWNTHIYANRQRRRIHVKTHACTRARARVYTYTKRSFVIGDPSLWKHLPHTVKMAGSNSLSRFWICNSELYLIWLIIVKYGAKCPITSYKTSVFTWDM